MHAPLNFKAMVRSTAVDESYPYLAGYSLVRVRERSGCAEVQAGLLRELGRGQGCATGLRRGHGYAQERSGKSTRLSVPVVSAPAMGVL